MYYHRFTLYVSIDYCIWIVWEKRFDMQKSIELVRSPELRAILVSIKRTENVSLLMEIAIIYNIH